MTRYVLQRLAGAALVLLALSVLVYALFYLAPGDPARLACGERCNPQQIAQVRERLGLDEGVFTQYLHFLQGMFAGRDYTTGTSVVHCDAPCLGLSYQGDQQVTRLILERLPATASLALGALVVWLVVGVGTGLLSALRRGGPTERVLTVLTLAATGTPVFILGLLLLMVVCAYLQWLPFPSYVPLGEDPEQWAWNMLLPWLTLGFFESAKYARLTRSSTLETLAEDHIRTFRAYGVGSGPSSPATRCAAPSRRSSRSAPSTSATCSAGRCSPSPSSASPDSARPSSTGCARSTCRWWWASSW